MKRTLACLASMLTLASALPAGVTPSPFINFQGVLQANQGAPPIIPGDYGMEFHFFDDPDPAMPENEILVDSHDTNPPVRVVDGLFNVVLGGGIVMDGSGPDAASGPYTDLGQVFRDFDEVWLEVRVGIMPFTPGGPFESLLPRIRILSSAYALNAGRLEGKRSAEFIDTSATPQVKAGDLSVGNLTVSGNTVSFGSPGALISALGGSGLNLFAGDADMDDIILAAGNSLDDGRLTILGDGDFEMRSGGGFFNFVNGVSGLSTATLDASGNLQFDGNLTVAGDTILFGSPGAVIGANSTRLSASAGDADTDDLLLISGNSIDDGGILVFGDDLFQMHSGNGTFNFVNGATSVQTAQLDPSGNLQMNGDLSVSGGDLTFQTNLDFSAHLRNAFDIEFHKDTNNNNASAWFQFWTDGDTVEQLRIVDGNEAAANFDGAVNANGIDYAEAFQIADPTLEPGDVVSLKLDAPGFIERADKAHRLHVVGVISEKPGFVTGNSFDAEEEADPRLAAQRREARETGDWEVERALSQRLIEIKEARQRPVALLGRVPVKVDGAYGSIRPGDPLTISLTPGHAAAISEAGSSIGVALQAWDGPGKGRILAFVNPVYHAPTEPLEKAREAPAEAARPEDAPAPDFATGIDSVAGRLQVVLDPDPDDEARYSILRDGEEIDARAEVFRVQEPVAAGDVLVADRERPGVLRKASLAADPAVVGVVSSVPGILFGRAAWRILSVDVDLAGRLDEARRLGDRKEEAILWRQVEARLARTHAPVALSGTVLCKADASYAAIRVGDLLTASPTPGHAMRAEEPEAGTVVGKALEPLDSGTRLIKVLVVLR